MESANKTAIREIFMDPYKFETYDVRGPRSMAGWPRWFDTAGDKVCSWEETCRLLNII